MKRSLSIVTVASIFSFSAFTASYALTVSSSEKNIADLAKISSQYEESYISRKSDSFSESANP